jgi:hypothetical protein
MYAVIILPVHATCFARHILLHLIAVIIFGEQYKQRIFLLCSFHQLLVNSYYYILYHYFIRFKGITFFISAYSSYSSYPCWSMT